MSAIVHVYGAGSIGNHLTYACRQKNWEVTVIDLDPAALDRMRSSIYPSRYGTWDSSIRLATSDKLAGPSPDVVIVGTPPDSHLKVAFDILRRTAPKVMCVEKPLCTPDLSQCDQLEALANEKGTIILAGYNHTMVPASFAALDQIRSGVLGRPLTAIAEFREYLGRHL